MSFDLAKFVDDIHEAVDGGAGKGGDVSLGQVLGDGGIRTAYSCPKLIII